MTLRITIDGRPLEVPEGSTVLQAARQAGIDIPTLCERGPDKPALTTCMVCVVRVNGSPRLTPSCATRVVDQMRIESEAPDVLQARRTAVELLLSDHVGPCVAPCQSVCPAHMHIDRMLDQIAAEDWSGAIRTIKADIPIPAVLGRICPDLCEKGCRRKNLDAPVSICRLKREAADRDLASDSPYRPVVSPPTGKRVAIIGAGPAGLSAAYYLAQAGHACVIFDRHADAGGSLLTHTTPEELPRAVLAAEIQQIRALGVQFLLGRKAAVETPTAPSATITGPILVQSAPVGATEGSPRQAGAAGAAVGFNAPESFRPGRGERLHPPSATDPERQFDAVLLATGTNSPVPTDRQTARTLTAGIFATGAAAGGALKYAVQAVGDGHFAARAVIAYLAGLPPLKRAPEWNCAGPAPSGAELAERAAEVCCAPHDDSAPSPASSADDWAPRQADRCLRCGCPKADDCTLREVAAALDANPNAYRGDPPPQRRPHMPPLTGTLPDGRTVTFDNGKCIACGRCVTIAQEAGEPYGLAWNGRGFAVHLAPALGVDLAAALHRSADACAHSCPTAALMVFPKDVAI